MTDTKLDLLLTATDKASPVFGRVGKSAGRLGNSFAGLKKAVGLLVGAFAITRIARFGSSLIEAGEAAATANSRIGNITNQMGLFGEKASAVADRLVRLANKQSLATGVDRNAIKATQAKLLTFKELARSADEVGGYFDRATQSAIDLAAAGFGSAESNATQLGKALNDPITGVSALAEAGITFTAAEKEKIRVMQESGNIAGAQEMILSALEQQVGGTAAATANMSDRMKVAWAAIKERIGTWLLPAFNKFANVVIDRVMPALHRFGNWFRDVAVPAIKVFWDAIRGNSAAGRFEGALGRINDVGVFMNKWLVKTREFIAKRVFPIMQALGRFITGTLVPAVVSVVQWIIKNRDWLAALAVAVGAGVLVWKAYTTTLAIWRAATVAATVVQGAFNAIMAANPIGIIITAIAALVAGLVYFFTQTDTGKKAWKSFTNAMVKAWNWLWEKVLKPGIEALTTAWNWLWENVIKPVVDFIVEYFKMLGRVYMWLWRNVLSPVIKALAAAWRWLWNSIIKPVINFIVGYIKMMATIYTWLWQNIISPVINAIATAWGWLYENVIKRVIDFIVAYIKTLAAVYTWLWENVISPVIDAIATAWSWLWDNVVGPAIQRAKTMFEGLKTAFGKVKDFFTDKIDRIKEVFEGLKDALGAVKDFFTDKVDAIKDVFGGIADTITGAFKGAFNGIADIWNKSVGSLSFTVPDWVPGIGGKGWDVPDMPKFFRGGVMPHAGFARVGEYGEEQVFLPAGARVVPGSGGGSGGEARIASEDIKMLGDYIIEAAGIAADGRIGAVDRGARIRGRQGVVAV